MRPADVEDVFGLSPLQQGLLLHCVQEPDSRVYFVQIAATLQGQLDTAALQAAWRDLVARHAALRTIFRWDGLAAPVQIVRRDLVPQFRCEDWQAEVEASRDRKWRDLRE